MASSGCMNMSTSTRAAGVLGMDSMPKCFNLLPASSSSCRVLKMPSSTSFTPLVTRNCPKSSIVCKAQGAANEVLVVTDSSWDSLVVANESPVLVEFWAPWCGPCRMIAPVIDELAKEYAGKLACYKVNTDDCPTIATQCGIRSIPTVLLFKNGEKKESVIGAVPKSTLTATIEKYIQV